MTKKDDSQEDAVTPEKEKARLYNAAQRTLRENHSDEFKRIITGLYSEAGYTYRRRLTAEERAERERREADERAEAQLAKLLQRYPHLAERVETNP